VDFLLALIEHFSLGVMAEALRVIISSKSAILLQPGPVDPKFQVEGVAPTNHSSSQKTRLHDLSYGIKIYKNLDRSFYRFVTIHACDRRTDRQTDTLATYTLYYCIVLYCLLKVHCTVMKSKTLVLN